jgi:glutamyl-tRNA reductase
MIDYRKILKAYMDNVGENEGVFFIGPVRDKEQLEGLTEEESAALMDIYDELAIEPSVSTWEEEWERDRKQKVEREAKRHERDRIGLEERKKADEAEAQRIRAQIFGQEKV